MAAPKSKVTVWKISKRDEQNLDRYDLAVRSINNRCERYRHSVPKSSTPVGRPCRAPLSGTPVGRDVGHGWRKA